MAHGKETPRQKMIGMMYLVLTAMLALNVSTSYLRAFALVDTGLTRTTKNYTIKNEKLYTEFENAFTVNPTKVGPWKNKTDEIKKQAKEIIEFVQDCKLEIAIEGDGPEAVAIQGREINAELIITTTNTHIGSLILIGLNGNGKAFELKRKIDKFREYLVSLIDPQKAPELLSSIKGILTTENPAPESDGTVKTWESSRFEGMPLIATMPQLTKVQVDVLNCEAEIINYLLQQVGANEFKFNVLGATVIPNSNQVFLNNEFKAEVFLAASDTTQQPKIYIGRVDSTLNRETGEYNYEIKGTAEEIPVSKNGRGVYRRKASSLGPISWSGLIEMRAPDGSITRKPFKHKYLVSPSTVVVSPTKMNVLYIGVENPLEISVPGLTPDKITATIDKGSLNKIGNSFVAIPKQGERTCNITVYAQLEGRNRSEMGTLPFRVRPVPPPETSVMGLKGTPKSVSKNDLGSCLGIEAKMPDWFEFSYKFKVTKFTIMTISAAGVPKVQSSNNQMFTEAQRQLINTLKSGNVVNIIDIEAIGDAGEVKELSPLVFKIK